MHTTESEIPSNDTAVGSVRVQASEIGPIVLTFTNSELRTIVELDGPVDVTLPWQIFVEMNSMVSPSPKSPVAT